jgi:DNA-binding MarR family transcriptional regulator
MSNHSLSEKKIGLLIWHASNYWQAKLRQILKKFNISLNEYLILESLHKLKKNSELITQTKLSSFSGIDVSVVSVCLKSLDQKNLIDRKLDKDNRKKLIDLLMNGNKLFEIIFPHVEKQENYLFEKLKNEKINFCNSLKLILGKKIRIKAIKNL